ncbi:hypothetical protein P8452_70831 [Trifolium repens]|nr:AP-2 complex subunit alpha-1 [Trifolium repens]WJX88783.1 hypothetical protein P8452_70831 [Trifolium repens]
MTSGFEWYSLLQTMKTYSLKLQQKAREYLDKPVPYMRQWLRYGSSIEVEIQQRAVEYFALSRKGEALMDILAEMPKFPELQSALIKKAEDTEVDTAEQRPACINLTASSTAKTDTRQLHMRTKSVGTSELNLFTE